MSAFFHTNDRSTTQKRMIPKCSNFVQGMILGYPISDMALGWKVKGQRQGQELWLTAKQRGFEFHECLLVYLCSHVWTFRHWTRFMKWLGCYYDWPVIISPPSGASVCFVPRPNSTTERPRKPKIGRRMEVHHTSNPWTWGQKSRSPGRLMLTQ